MDESQHISLMQKDVEEDKETGHFIKNKITEVFRYYWSSDEKAFFLQSKGDNIKNAIPLEEIKEVPSFDPDTLARGKTQIQVQNRSLVQDIYNRETDNLSNGSLAHISSDNIPLLKI